MKIFLGVVFGLFMCCMVFGHTCYVDATRQSVNSVYEVYDYGPGDVLDAYSDCVIKGGEELGEYFDIGFRWYSNGTYAFTNEATYYVAANEERTIYESSEVTIFEENTPSSVAADCYVESWTFGEDQEGVYWLRSH